ncbi:AAA family ATPase [Ferroacidibacillus organovorans]|uniref:ATP-binding protein n=1 Tax=Ferroacidibacillus organovorans TaxID=1765683 RepID=A0A162T9I6_9BACL|nr:MoxR family ATPase [Ferroacidibacillus organovorans]KYP80591.1 ATPase [Ferroacidibacillus organovorans]OAG92904.1 ATPase [Ferroacidibacillus organovorans]OPG15855.1 ATP-binding protein [Ferroacidibacillus organovorans]
MKVLLESVEQVEELLVAHGYIAERSLCTAVFLALRLERPLFLEGEAGVGKTEIAKTLADALSRPLLRLQCYEGIDRQTALYDWNYARQLLHIRLREAGKGDHEDESWEERVEKEVYSERFLLRRPLLQAISTTPAPVLLIDEVDRSDVEFEAFLLELLAEFQVTIPELGTIHATEKPLVILTSNRTREMHDALKRRCLYYWIDYPTIEKELRIVTEHVPNLAQSLTRSLCLFIQRLREEPLYKVPGLAETIYFAQALEALHVRVLDEAVLCDTIGCLLKYRDDLELLTGEQGRARVAHLLAEV